MRIIFMGTPDFAACILQKMIDEDKNIIAVVTSPDKPSGRGLNVKKSAVKELAEKYSLRLFQPEDLSDNNFMQSIRDLNPDLQMVVAFRILPDKIWSIPKFGTVNLHASLLPKYRGAAPINWAIINGEKETGLTTFFINNGVDTGDLIMQEKLAISDNDNFDTLYNKMKDIGANLVLKTIQLIKDNSCPRISQFQNALSSKAPKIYKSDCEINWNQSSEKVRNFIRGLSSNPGAFTYLNGIYYKIFEVLISDHINKLQPGEISIDKNKNQVLIGTSSGSVSLQVLQKEGKKRMDIKTFLLGNSI